METKTPGRGPKPDSQRPSAAFATEVVAALDRLFDYLISAVPTESVSWEIPLTFSEVRAAKKIPPAGPVTMRVLADALGVSLPCATHLVDRLVAKGVVVRTRPEYDRRLVLVELSEESKTHRDLLFRSRVERVQSIMEPLTPAARQQVVRVLDEIAQTVPSQHLPVHIDKRDIAAAMPHPAAGKRS